MVQTLVLQTRGGLSDFRGGGGVHSAPGVPTPPRQGHLLGPGVHDSVRESSLVSVPAGVDASTKACLHEADYNSCSESNDLH